MKYSTKIKAVILIVCVWVLTSCDMPECTNTNPIFENYSPGSKQYNDEVVRLKNTGSSSPRYWFESYENDGDKEYIHVFIQGDSLCAKAILTVKDWHGLEGIQRTQGKGYRGAELDNLNFEVYQDSSRTELIFQSVDKIID